MKRQDLLLAEKAVLQYIDSQQLREGDTIPPVRELQAELYLSRNVILSALASLRSKGVVSKGDSARQGYKLCVCPGLPLSSYGAEQELTAQFLLPFYTWNYTINKYLSSFENVFSSHGIDLTFNNTHNSVDEERRLLEGIYSKTPSARPDFLLFATCNSCSNPNLDILEKINNEIPVILIDRYFPTAPYFQYIGVNNTYIGSRAAQYLLQNRHRNIGYVKAYNDLSTIKERFVAFCSTLADADVFMPRQNIFEISGKDVGFITDIQNEADSIGARILSLPERPTAIVCSFDRIGVALIKFFLKNNVRIPEDICIIGCDNDLDVAPMSPLSLTTFRHPYRKCAEEAVERMLRLKKDADSAPRKIEYYSEFMIGESTQP